MPRLPSAARVLAALAAAAGATACDIYGESRSEGDAGPGDRPSGGACYFYDGTMWEDDWKPGSCRDDVAEADCTADGGYPEAGFVAGECCSAGLAEILKNAEDCRFSSEEGGGGSDAGAPDPGVTCRASGQSCDPFGEAAKPQLCVTGTYCRIDSYYRHECDPVAQPGGTCGNGVGNSCPAGETCAIEDRRGRDPKGTCEAAPGDGEACDGSCAPGYWCRRGEGGTEWRCEAQVGDGAACTTSWQCRSLWCPAGGGRCAPYPCPAP